MDFDIEKFSYRLNVLLDDNNMKQTELAKKVGTTNVTICRYLNGERTPRLDVVARIASYFNISIDYLIGLSDDKTYKNQTNNKDLNISSLISELYSLENNSNLTNKQIEAIKKLLLENKDLILAI